MATVHCVKNTLDMITISRSSCVISSNSNDCHLFDKTNIISIHNNSIRDNELFFILFFKTNLYFYKIMQISLREK